MKENIKISIHNAGKQQEKRMNAIIIVPIVGLFIGICFSHVILYKTNLKKNSNRNEKDKNENRNGEIQRNKQFLPVNNTKEGCCPAKKITNSCQDIKNKHKVRIDNAVMFSDKISLYIRYLAITGLGLIWLLVEGKEYELDALLHNPYAQIIIISCLLTLILELVHLIMNVIVNLLYANSRLRKPLSYVAKPRKTQYVATKFPRSIVKIEWTIWFVKIICLMVALLVFICCLLYKMFE